MNPRYQDWTCKIPRPPMVCEPAPNNGKVNNTIPANDQSRIICSWGNFRCSAPRRYDRACRRDRTVSYINEGSPTLVKYKICSSGSSHGRFEMSWAGSKSLNFVKSSRTYAWTHSKIFSYSTSRPWDTRATCSNNDLAIVTSPC